MKDGCQPLPNKDDNSRDRLSFAAGKAEMILTHLGEIDQAR
jgi:hypothetical protein